MLTPMLATSDPAEIAAICAAHRAHADSATELTIRPWGEEAFNAVLLGYRFLIAGEQPA